MRTSIFLTLLVGCISENEINRLNDLNREGGIDSGLLGSGDDEADLDRRVRSAGTDLWFGFMENLDLVFNGPPTFAVVLRSHEPTTGVVRAPVTGLEIPLSLGADEILELNLPDTILYPEGAEVISNFGFQIVADAPVEATALHYRLYFSEASMVLPLRELGDAYLVHAVPDLDGTDPSEFLVISTADGTEVEITPSVPTDSLRPAGVPFTVTLDAGQTFQLQATGDLSGSQVRAPNGERLAVFSGAKQADVGCENGADSHLYDQNLPFRRWGRRYVAVPFANQDASTVRILAAEDDTEVRLSCGSPVVLSAGEVLATDITEITEITASARISVAQVHRSAACGTRSPTGDPSMVVLQPTALTRPKLSSLTPQNVDTLQRAQHSLNIVLPNGGAASLNGAPVDRLDELSSGVQAGALAISGGDFSLEADVGVQGIAYGQEEFDAYTYGLGYDCEGCLRRLDDAGECD